MGLDMGVSLYAEGSPRLASEVTSSTTGDAQKGLRSIHWAAPGDPSGSCGVWSAVQVFHGLVFAYGKGV
jgi:hypothetical protein